MELAEDDEDEEGHNVTERTPFLKTQRGRNATPSDANLKSRALSIDPLAPSSAFDETLRDRLSAERKEDEDDDDDELQREDGTGEGSGDGRLLERNWRAPPGKKIAVPVRIEPKVYFATERTFLVRPSSSCSVYFPVNITHNFHRNGSTLPSSSELSPQPSSTLFRPKTSSDSSALVSSPLQPLPLLLTLPSSSS